MRGVARPTGASPPISATLQLRVFLRAPPRFSCWPRGSACSDAGARARPLVVLEARECHGVPLDEGRSEVAFAGRAPSVDFRASPEGWDVAALFSLRGSRDVILRDLALL